MLDNMSSSLVLSLMSKPIKSSKLSNFCGAVSAFFSAFSSAFLASSAFFLASSAFFAASSAFLASSAFFLASSAFFLASSAFFLASSSFFLASSSRFFLAASSLTFNSSCFFFFSTITPRHHSASLSFDTVWSRIAWKFWISPLSSWVMDFWISSLLGLVITLLCFSFWSITSNMYPDDFNISSSELCNLVWRFSGMVGGGK
ncbi:uncharacterized protein CAALFM_C106190CA [Candida albicans SC5314]|uniref:Uncharacterized protein n=1 Tax=Candida albicans (strain SC5314 / ATCC MYA-2876) TaxID=237561 RepID=A0A1D8PDS8_CANAL|nr:uncharacterized protein CAALFM_C106190CA [Candida albicans SC5314]AOW26281.1 hypothetical protein CAALFM_C106190CA [Candida albicans SC5314]|eukprot:XP_710009.2 hypothetical protein CAALFM_C106190CA [Candida albicans SC5314]